MEPLSEKIIGGEILPDSVVKVDRLGEGLTMYSLNGEPATV